MILAVAATKGAPGATTFCVGTACLFLAQRAVILVEADPEGGCLSARLQLPQEPGLSTLAAAGRHALSEQVLAKHLKSFPSGVAMVVAPSSPTHARSALRAVASELGRVLAELSHLDVIVDLGRLDAESPSLPLAAAADHVLFLGHPTLEDADALAVRLAELGELRRRSSLVTVGPGPYDGAEVARTLDLCHAGHLPKDDEGAALLWSSPDRALRSRRPLVRSLAQIAARLQPRAAQRIDAGSDGATAGRLHLAQGSAP